MIKRIASLTRRIVGRISKEMLASFLMTIGAISIPVAFVLLVAAYEFKLVSISVAASIVFLIGIISLWRSLLLAWRADTSTRIHRQTIDRLDAERHNDMKILLQSINTKLGDIGKGKKK